MGLNTNTYLEKGKKRLILKSETLHSIPPHHLCKLIVK